MFSPEQMGNKENGHQGIVYGMILTQVYYDYKVPRTIYTEETVLDVLAGDTLARDYFSVAL